MPVCCRSHLGAIENANSPQRRLSRHRSVAHPNKGYDVVSCPFFICLMQLNVHWYCCTQLRSNITHEMYREPCMKKKKQGLLQPSLFAHSSTGLITSSVCDSRHTSHILANLTVDVRARVRHMSYIQLTAKSKSVASLIYVSWREFNSPITLHYSEAERTKVHFPDWLPLSQMKL